MAIRFDIFGILLLYFFITIVLGYCQGKFNGQYSQCNYAYGYNDTSCTIFRFDYCQYSDCLSYSPCGNSTCCDNYTMLNSSNWDFCINHCCGKGYPIAYSSFQQCQYDILIQSLLYVIIGGPIIVVLLIIFLIVCIRKNKKRKEWCEQCWISIFNCFKAGCRRFFNLLTCRCFRKIENSQKLQCYYEQTPQTEQTTQNWKKDTYFDRKANEVCIICFEPGPSLHLECGHIFHRKCILSFLDISEKCLRCGSKQISKSKIYCEGCFKKSYKINVKENRQILRTKRYLCQKCQRKNER